MLKRIGAALLRGVAKGATYLQAKFPVNRVVVLLTPLVFVPISGFVTAWVAKNFPGLPHFDPAQITGAFVAGSFAALTAAYRWLKGWEAHEARQGQRVQIAHRAEPTTVHVHLDGNKVGEAVAKAGKSGARK